MSPTVEKPTNRIFNIRFKDGSNQAVIADTICKPRPNDSFYRLKRDGELVAEYDGADVSGWCVLQDEFVTP